MPHYHEKEDEFDPKANWPDDSLGYELNQLNEELEFKKTLVWMVEMIFLGMGIAILVVMIWKSF